MSIHSNRQAKTQSSRLTGLFILLAVLLVLGGIYYARQDIFDWARLRNYQPPVAVSQLADQDTMTPYARRVFYVNKPALKDKTDFKQCRINTEQTIVLGCYHGFQNGIYILTVPDPRLEGVEQVTAAHEMLHAAYDRLSNSQRKNIDTMLQNYYNHELKDERVRQTVEAYRSSEPNDLTNEMHSIFGTEVANLPAPLEQYYTRYFTDRARVTGFAAQYQQEFTSRRDAIKNYDTQLKMMKIQIDSINSDLAARQKTIDNDSARLQQLRDSDVPAYNAAVPGFNSTVNSFNIEVDQVKGLVTSYNELVNTRNAVALEAQHLTDEINSNVAPITTK